ncbi:MAG: hypothetical protein QNJ22_05160 [Desulfosarcinaceae bacterium]|nr:hypothetical protein [Desulfosarcinaceae bacterium]
METFTTVKPLVANPEFASQRRRSQTGLTGTVIDGPLQGLIRDLNALPHCFTLQCCWGHFVHVDQTDPNNLAPLPSHGGPAEVSYRIAYLALCVDNCDSGKRLLALLEALTALSPGTIQLGSATWFWDQQVNTYVLQVMPERFKYRDRAVLPMAEARTVERMRRHCFRRLKAALAQGQA